MISRNIAVYGNFWLQPPASSLQVYIHITQENRYKSHLSYTIYHSPEGLSYIHTKDPENFYKLLAPYISATNKQTARNSIYFIQYKYVAKLPKRATKPTHKIKSSM